jgi:hypothetical protein
VRMAFVVVGSTFAVPAILFLVACGRNLKFKRRSQLTDDQLRRTSSTHQVASNIMENEVATVSASVSDSQSLELRNEIKSLPSNPSSHLDSNRQDQTRKSQSRYRYLHNQSQYRPYFFTFH